VNIGGAAHAFNYMSSIINIFSGAQPGVTVNMEAEGEPAGLRRLCNGENDIAVATSELSSDQAANCEANDISTQTLDLGTEAVVLLANGESSYLDCLTTDQISAIWGADSTETINNWQAVDRVLPDIDMTLFAPIAGDHYTDLLLTQNSGRALANRLDTELDRDPLYRAAATANVAGALTYMGWPDYLNVLINQQNNIQLVAIDRGMGCVRPDETSISSRSYPLVRSLKLIINRSSLTDPVVQSFLWFLVSDENFSVLDNSGFIGIDFGDLPVVRATLRRAFLEAQAEQFAARIEPESTEEPIVETTPETTEEAAVETTPESND
jgi:phosphate transport system substrate-binding protein